MRGNVEAIKERLAVDEVIGGYIKLEKAGANFKARCPFHSEKTPSFFVSPGRGSYYCFGCGARGDIFSFVQEIEGVEFKEALKTLAERANIELVYEGRDASVARKGEEDLLLDLHEEATLFYESNLKKNNEALEYLRLRGVLEESVRKWRLGFAPDEWRSLRSYMHKLGRQDDVLLKGGLVKKPEESGAKEPYDTFRGRIIFPLSNPKGEVVAFSGRALSKDTEPKYLNSPESQIFHKQELLYGLDKARDEIRRRDYSVLVEGQLDLVLSHQAGVGNTVASSGTAFTEAHLSKLKRLSQRIILAFDGDRAGILAAERSAALALSLGMEVKVARVPEGSDPAELASKSKELWKTVLREARPAIEVFLDEILAHEPDSRKAAKVIEKKLLPILLLVESAMERSHYVSLIAKRTGLREEVIVEDLRRVRAPQTSGTSSKGEESDEESTRAPVRSRREELDEVLSWLKEDPKDRDLLRHEFELRKLVRIDELDEEIMKLRRELHGGDSGALERIARLTRERDEEKRKVL